MGNDVDNLHHRMVDGRSFCPFSSMELNPGVCPPLASSASETSDAGLVSKASFGLRIGARIRPMGFPRQP